MFRSKKLAVLVAGVAAALAVGSLAFASIPDGSGVIHGCFNKDSGALRVTDPTTNQPKGCNSKEVSLDWDQHSSTKAYTLDWSYTELQPQPNGWTTVASRSVPAGKYLVSAKLYVTAHGLNVPATTVTCSLGASGGNGGSADYSVGTVSSNGTGNVLVAPIALENDNSVPLVNGGGTVSVACQSAAPVEAHQLKITATEIDSVDAQ